MFKHGEGILSQTAMFAEQYYGPDNNMNGFEKARFHFKRSVEISGGINAGTYISLASTVSVNEQNLEEFEKLLHTALEIDPDLFPEMRLAGIIYKDKAQWLLDHKSDYFLLDFDEGDFNEVF